MTKATLRVLALGGVVAVGLAVLRTRKAIKELKDAVTKEVNTALKQPEKALEEARKVYTAEVKPQVDKVIWGLKNVVPHKTPVNKKSKVKKSKRKS